MMGGANNMMLLMLDNPSYKARIYEKMFLMMQDHPIALDPSPSGPSSVSGERRVVIVLETHHHLYSTSPRISTIRLRYGTILLVSNDPIRVGKSLLASTRTWNEYSTSTRRGIVSWGISACDTQTHGENLVKSGGCTNNATD